MDLASGVSWVCRVGATPDAVVRAGLVVMTECVREMDTVARLGGDEFVVMLGELDSDKVVSMSRPDAVAKGIRTSLALS